MESSERPGLMLRPFHGVRYTVSDAAAVTSPPYDLVGANDVRILLDAHPNNVVRLILPGAGHYADARALLDQWMAEGVLATDAERALYVYEQRGPGVFQRGLIGAVGIDTDAILPHEEVMPGPVADRLALMRSTEANLEPIFLLYTGGGAASRLVDNAADHREPILDFTAGGGIRHRLWAIADAAEIAAVAEDLAPRQAMIADGHHRYATYQALRAERGAPGPWDGGLALLVDSTAYPPELKAIHRVLPDLPLREAAARAKGAWRVNEYAELDEGLEALAASDGPAYLLAGDGPAHLLTDPDPMQVEHALPEKHSAIWRSLPTAILAEFLLPKVWGLTDDEAQVQIVHHDPRTAIALALAQNGTAVLLNPLKAEDVYAVAAEGERVPRKSTSFAPKPLTGLVLRTFAAD